MALEHAEIFGANIKVIRLEENIGKGKITPDCVFSYPGGAVRVGVLCSSGRLILFADADGATKFVPAFKTMEEEMIKYGDTPAVVIGSRTYLQHQAETQRPFHRNLLMHCFHFMVQFFAVKKIKDTQCGFKLFNRLAAAEV